MADTLQCFGQRTFNIDFLNWSSLFPPRTKSTMLQTALVSTLAGVPVRPAAPNDNFHAYRCLAPHHRSFKHTSNSDRSLATRLQRQLLPGLPRACLHGLEALGVASQKFQPHPKQPHSLGGVEQLHRTHRGFVCILRCI
jgi:hypothetical protein